MAYRSRIDLATHDEIVEKMLAISREISDWDTARRDAKGLWYKLARCFVQRHLKSAAEKLYTRYTYNRSKLRVEFGKTVGVDVMKLRSPMAHSTPKPSDLYCVCRRPYSPEGRDMIFCDICSEWFHGDCIEINVKKEEDISIFTCPGCKENFQFQYQQDWLHSFPLPEESISTISAAGSCRSSPGKHIISDSSEDLANPISDTPATPVMSAECPNSDVMANEQSPPRLVRRLVSSDNEEGAEVTFCASWDAVALESSGSIEQERKRKRIRDSDIDVPVRSLFPALITNNGLGSPPQSLPCNEVTGLSPSMAIETNLETDNAALECNLDDNHVKPANCTTRRLGKPKIMLPKSRKDGHKRTTKDNDLQTPHTPCTKSLHNPIVVANEEDEQTYGGSSEDDFKPSKAPITRNLKRTKTVLPVSCEKEQKSSKDCAKPSNASAKGRCKKLNQASSAPDQVACEKTIRFMKSRDIPIPGETVQIRVPRDTWDCFVHEEEGEKKLHEGWADIIREAIRLHNPACSFAFRDSYFVKRLSMKHFWRTTGYCKHDNCFDVAVEALRSSLATNEVVFNLIYKGSFCHEWGDRERNQIAYHRRMNFMHDLTHRTGDHLATELNAKVDMDLVKCGNANELMRCKILTQIRHEKLKEKDLHRDPIQDLGFRLNCDKELNDYVQMWSCKPVVVVMFSERQLKILKDLRRATKHVVAYIDATGGACRKISLENNRKLFNYAICVRSPILGGHPIAICEFILDDQSEPSIYNAIRFFHQRATQYIKPERGVPIIDRYQTDYCPALLNAVISIEWTNMLMRDYLVLCFKELLLKTKPSRKNVRICRTHMMKALMDNLREPRHGIAPAHEEDLKKILRYYILSRTMDEVVFYVRKLFIILLSKFVTPNVTTALQTCRDPMPSSFKADYNWSSYVNEDEEPKQIYKTTPFGSFFIDLRDTVMEEQDQCARASAVNPCYSASYVQYLIVNILPLTPLMTRAMVNIRGDTHSYDTQNPVEKWHDLIKNHQKCKDLKLSRYVDRDRQIIEGRSKFFQEDIVAFINSKRKQKNKEVQALAGATPKGTLESRGWGRKLEVGPVGADSTISLSPSPRVAKADVPTYQQKEEWKRGGSVVGKRNNDIGLFRSLPYIRWGQKSTDTCPATFTNTCTVDNTFMALLYIYNKYIHVRTFIDSGANVRIEQLRHVIGLLNSKGGPKSNAARYYWVRSVLGKSVDLQDLPHNLWGEEHVNSLQPVGNLSSEYLVEQRCENDDFSSVSTLRVFGLMHGAVEDSVMHINHGGLSMTRCPTCRCVTNSTVKKPTDATRILPFLMFGVCAPLSVNDMPRVINVIGDRYDLVACSVHHNFHFRLVFIQDSDLYEYDGKENTKIVKYNPKGRPLVSICYYVKAS